MSQDSRDKLEQARRAVEAAYGGVDRNAGADPASPVAAADPSSPRTPQEPAAAAPLARARGLARGAPEGARKGSSSWRRMLRATLGRLIRFETAWQHEFNLAAVEAAETTARRLDTVVAALNDIRRELGDVRRIVARTQERLVGHETEADRLREQVENALQTVEQATGTLDRRLQAQERSSKTTAAEMRNRTDKIAEALSARDDALDKELGRFRNQIKQALRGADNLRQGLVNAAQRVTVLENGRRELSAGIENVKSDLSAARRELGESRERQEREARKLGAGVESLSRRLGMEESHLDALEFARRFRGSEEEIRRRLRRYIDLLQASPVTRAGPVLEIGSGRGEFLHLCRDAGIPAAGIDSDTEVVAHCRAAGLDAQAGDAIQHLAETPAASLAAIFSAQTVEHLPAGALQELIRESFRTLRPGGLLILETLNPGCLSILATTFYRDPGHRQPLHPETATFLLETAGFHDVHAVRHTPVPTEQRLGLLLLENDDSPELTTLKNELNRDLVRLNDLLFTDQEYHVIGSHP